MIRRPSAAEIEAELCRRSLATFIREGWHVLEPGTEYADNWHIDYVCEHLEAVTARELCRLLVNIPPRHMKSRIASVFWPVWEWVNDPTNRYIFSSYALELSRSHSVDRAALINSPWFQARWGDRFSLTQDTKTLLTNDRAGMMFARGTAGAGTGLGGNRVVVDDPHNTKQAESDVQREAALLDFDRNLATRLNNQETGAVVVIMQRLHEKDISGHILADIGGYTHIKLEAQTTPAQGRKAYTFPRSGREVVREPGDLLWPERFPESVLARLKRQMGSYAYAGQYEQNPIPSGGGVFEGQWWRYYRGPFDLDAPDVGLVIQSWDMAFKDTADSAFVVGQVWAQKGASKYLVHQVRDRMSFVDTCKAVQRVSARFPQATTKLIEDKANGPAVISALSKKVSGLIAIEPYGSKQARAEAYSVQCEAGNVYLPDPELTPWSKDFIEEHSRCPKGEFWDQIDAAGQAVLYLAKREGALFDAEDEHYAGDDLAVNAADSPFAELYQW